MENKNIEVIKAYREAADWLEAHPELPTMYVGNMGVFHMGDQKVTAPIVAKAMGHVVKDFHDSSIHLNKYFGPDKLGNIAAVLDRDQVCERVQTGTKTIPATEERIIPAEPEKEVPVYEWKCGSIFGAAEKEEEVTT